MLETSMWSMQAWSAHTPHGMLGHAHTSKALHDLQTYITQCSWLPKCNRTR